jgi:hypothetical protein
MKPRKLSTTIGKGETPENLLTCRERKQHFQKLPLQHKKPPFRKSISE